MERWSDGETGGGGGLGISSDFYPRGYFGLVLLLWAHGFACATLAYAKQNRCRDSMD